MYDTVAADGDESRCAPIDRLLGSAAGRLGIVRFEHGRLDVVYGQRRHRLSHLGPTTPGARVAEHVYRRHHRHARPRTHAPSEPQGSGVH